MMEPRKNHAEFSNADRPEQAPAVAWIGDERVGGCVVSAVVFPHVAGYCTKKPKIAKTP